MRDWEAVRQTEQEIADYAWLPEDTEGNVIEPGPRIRYQPFVLPRRAGTMFFTGYAAVISTFLHAGVTIQHGIQGQE